MLSKLLMTLRCPTVFEHLLGERALLEIFESYSDIYIKKDILLDDNFQWHNQK